MGDAAVKKHESGDWRTKDGQGRIVQVGPKEWQAQEMVPGGWWSWVSTRATKRDALIDLRAARQFIW